MATSLIESFMPYTQEERVLLQGDPLKKATYTNRRFFIVQSDLFIPAKQLITLRQHTRFTAFPAHWHDYIEIMFLLKGQVCHQLPDGKEICLKPGELLFINKHSPHEIAACGKEDIALNFMIKPAFLDFVPHLGFGDHPLAQLLLDGLRNEKKGPSYLHFQLGQEPAIDHLLKSMVHSHLSFPFSLALWKKQMELLFLHLLSLQNPAAAPPSSYQENPLALELLQEMNAHYTTFVLKDFAKDRRVSSSYLCRLMKEATGSTCTEILQQIRLEKAKSLLMETDLSIVDICAVIGYQNTSYFHRLFKSHLGTSPSLWRAMAK